MTPRARRSMLALVLIAPAGCGDDPTPGPREPRVEVLVSTIDGEPPEGLAVEPLRSKGPPVRYPLVPVPAEGPRVYEARGAPTGAYRLLAPGGWGMLWGVGTAPYLKPEGLPVAIRLGRPHSLYLFPERDQPRLSTTWAAQAIPDGDGPPTPVPVRVEQDDEGMVAVRFPPEAYAGHVEVAGRAEDGRLCEAIVTTFPPDGHPRVALLRVAGTAPLRVELVGAPGVPVGDLRVAARLVGLPLEERREVAASDGVAVFGGLPMQGKGLEVTAGAGAPFPVDLETWRAVGELWLLVAGREDPPAVRIPLADPREVKRAMLLPADGRGYGLVAWRATQDGVELPVPAGRSAFLLDLGDRWVGGVVDGDGARVEQEEPKAGCVVGGEVAGAPTGTRVLLRRREGDRWVLGPGLSTAVSAGGRYEIRVPSGDYQLVVERPGAPASPPRPLPLTPGSRVSLPL